KKEIGHTVGSGIRMTLLIGLPAAFGLFVLAKPIINLLYFNNTATTINNAGEILRYLSFGVIFLTLVQTLTAILQGLGKPIVPVINLFIGAIFKIILTYILTAIPSINIKGAAISTVVAYGTAAILDLFFLRVISKVKLNYIDIFIKPLISAAGMGILVNIAYRFLLNIVGGRIATIIAIGIGGVSYIILLIITGTLTDEDMKLIPKGNKIGRFLDKFKLLK